MGKPNPYPKFTPEQVARVLKKIECGEPHECWRWIAKAKDRKGRGKVRIDKRNYHVPRLLWELHNGPLPTQLRVYETCFNEGCCNPAHLDAKTQSEIQAIVWEHKNGAPKDRKLAQRVAKPQTCARPYPSLTEKDIARLWSKVEKGGAGDCWEWQAATLTDGYGVIKITYAPRKSRVLRAHRLVYVLTHGPITPVNQVVRHTCDNPACCNPAHLVLGTQLDNTIDRRDRDRCNHVIGSAVGTAKLKWSDIGVIRSRAEDYDETQEAIAADYGVHPSTIGDILLGKTWTGERRC